MVTPLIKIIDYDVQDNDTDTTLIQALLTSLTISHVYAVTVTHISNSRLRYCIIYD